MTTRGDKSTRNPPYPTQAAKGKSTSPFQRHPRPSPQHRCQDPLVRCPSRSCISLSGYNQRHPNHKNMSQHERRLCLLFSSVVSMATLRIVLARAVDWTNGQSRLYQSLDAVMSSVPRMDVIRNGVHNRTLFPLASSLYM